MNNHPSTRLLTMPSGERIQFGPNVNFLFESHDLSCASPATISRMGEETILNYIAATDLLQLAMSFKRSSEVIVQRNRIFSSYSHILIGSARSQHFDLSLINSK